ncbi:MAG: tRNA 2-selenouridine(34) synthase MnmH [Firmicutes bacterium]|nr:tRNA 2-selenouridine(34) synthase MnmH [Bacillota bacterium]
MDSLEIDLEEALRRDDLVWIDVRSPGEFNEASLPGAVNVPLLDDQERHEIGLLHRHSGEKAARLAALDLVAPKLPRLVARVAAAAGDKKPLLFCWRGGLRSLCLFQAMQLAGIPALRLKGGYRAYRRHIHRRLQNYKLRSTLLVLHGLTGVGKTELIRELMARGYPALDLEGLARHRGSVFGAVGLPGKRSQKDFDTLLLHELERFNGAPYLIVEGEGRRIGNIHLPAFLVEAMEKGVHVIVTASLAERVKRIAGDYLPPVLTAPEIEQIREALCHLRRRLGAAKTGYLLEQLDAGCYVAVVETLCRDYYDRLYGDAKPGRYDFIATIDTADMKAAVAQTAALIDGLSRKSLENKEEKGALTR